MREKYALSVEYMYNRVSLYAVQYQRCAVTGKLLWIDEIHCHHKKLISQGCTDEYKNLIIVYIDIHKLIHSLYTKNRRGCTLRFFFEKNFCL